TKSFSETFGDGVSDALAAALDVGQLLRTALSDPLNFHAEVAAGMPALISFKAPAVPPTTVLASPGASVAVRQTVVPLGLTIAQYGGAPPQGETQFDITALAADGVAQPRPPVFDDFAPAHYL